MGACTYATPPAPLPHVEGVLPAIFAGAPAGRVRRLQVTPSASYATGGDTLSPAAIGLRNIHAILIEPSANLAASHIGNSACLAGTSQAPLLKLFNAATGGGGAVAEVTAAQDLSNQPMIIWFIGD